LRVVRSGRLASVHPAGPGCSFPVFTGTLHPSDSNQYAPIALGPGYLNNIAGGSNDGATGFATIDDVPFGETEFVALAINISDLTGGPHRLSSENDPALGDIVSDLNNPAVNGGYTAYAFSDIPQAYAGAAAALATGESEYGGQPFDILVAENSTNPTPYEVLKWNFDFSGEIFSQQDEVSAISITDIGAIPEPSATALLAFVGSAVLFGRRRFSERRNRRTSN
jgi:hypothetical protein